MEKAKLEGFRQVNGRLGSVWWDGEQLFDVEEFEAKAKINRENVDMIGTLDVDSKITSIEGEGTLKLKKVYSRGIKKVLDAYKKGKDVRSQLIGKLADPDAYGTERVVIGNVWFNEVTIMQIKKEILTEDLPFGFTISSVSYPDLINAQ